MERHKSAIKAARQALVRRERNRNVKSEVRTAMKDFRDELSKLTAKSKESAEAVPKLLASVESKLMKAAKRKIIEPRAASRYVGRLSAAASRKLASL